MKLIKQCFPVVGFVFLKKVVQALEIAGEILKKIMKAVPAVLRLWVQSRKKEMKGVLSALCCMFESVDEIIINLSFSVVTFNSMLLCRFGTSLFCQVGTKESNKVKLNGREKIHIHLGILLTVLTCKHFNCKQSQF